MHTMTILISLFIWVGAHAAGDAPPVAAPSSNPAEHAPPPPDPVLRVEAAVAQNLKTEHGRKYADSASAAVAGKLGAALQTCRDSLAAGAGGVADTSGMDVYVVLNRRGMAKDLLVRPQGKMEQCMRAHLGASLAFPGPPDGNYCVKLRATQALAGSGTGKP